MLWEIFDRVRQGLAEQGLVTEADLFSGLAAHLPTLHTPPLEFVVVDEGLKPHEIAVFVRSPAQLDRARQAVAKADLLAHELDEHVEPGPWLGLGRVDTRHLAKGLEFRAVVVMACDDEVIPLQERIESIAADADLEEVYNTERHLLYVACTRARDQLLIASTAPASEFLDDLRG